MADMTSDERSTWLSAVVAILSFGIYVALLLARWEGGPVAAAAYAGPMLGTIGGGIIAIIAGNIILGIRFREEIGKRDVRDLEIGRLGAYVGQWLVVFGSIAALVLCLLRVDHFWIANTVYLGFISSAVLESATKIIAYRHGLPLC